jgi:hypothetical protein
MAGFLAERRFIILPTAVPLLLGSTAMALTAIVLSPAGRA